MAPVPGTPLGAERESGAAAASVDGEFVQDWEGEEDKAGQEQARLAEENRLLKEQIESLRAASVPPAEHAPQGPEAWLTRLASSTSKQAGSGPDDVPLAGGLPPTAPQPLR